MTNHTCDKCGRELDANTLFCPHCGAAVFHSSGAPARPPEPSPTEMVQEGTSRKFDYKKLIPPAAVVLALLLALALGWDTIASIFSPGEDPQLSTNPSTEQTSPSQTYAYDPDAKPTKSTAPSTKPSTSPTAQPPTTEPFPTLEGTSLAQEQLEEYEKKLSYSISGNQFYNLATTTVFSHPKEINLYLLFYNGIDGCPRELSDKELAHFVAIEETLQYVGVHVLPPDEMNQTLIEHFGITLEETDKRGLDEFAYWEETGNYYWFGTDANGNWDIEVIAGSTLPDGTIQILYRSASAGRDAEAKNESNLWIMTFTPEGKIFSNLPA